MTPLIECEDCGKSISDLAPHCIHCGRPNVPEAETSRGSRLKDLAQAVIERTGATARTVASKARQLGSGAKDVPGRVVAKIIEEREVEVLLLPLGSGPADFRCQLDLGDTLETLASGVLVRAAALVDHIQGLPVYQVLTPRISGSGTLSS